MRSLRSNSVLRALTIVGLGLAGLIGGHALGYALAVPDDIHRTALLEVTGHGYMPSASRVAVMLGITAVVAGIASGYAHRPNSEAPSLARAAVRLGVLQCVGFVALEVVERLLVSAPIGSLSLPVLVIGLLGQVVAAAALALVLVGARRLGAVLRKQVRASSGAGRYETVAVGRAAPSSTARLLDRVRGPPVFRMD